MSGLWKLLPTIVSQMRPPKPKFSTTQIPDLTGRIFIVTGGNTGVGYETAKALLEHNGTVYLACRNKDKAHAAISRLKEATTKVAIFLELDLGSLASVRRAAQEFLSLEKELHVLFNNAGVMFPPIGQLTSDGYDLQLGTNVLGHFYLTQLLMPALKAGKLTSPDGYARIVTVSSSGSYFYGINWDTFVDGPKRRRMGTKNLYFQSKLANVVVARQYFERYTDDGIISIACNPGNLKSDLYRHVPGWLFYIIDVALLYPPPLGALTQLWAGVMPETIEHNGKFLIPWARVGRTRNEAYDLEIGKRLWSWLQAQVDEFERTT
ncbi:NAD(P)-binding protein [Cristinia sonorae]|uniref:NAD(P)-binding protein n=1 Tax=Cristinia sonorae TaxID=1940300 RepID=A0A8K0UFT6_9AGAR|nr:NAD(P)-binding protein [Cristinia sonorae]